MPLFEIKWGVEENKAKYSLAQGASTNCKVLDFADFAQISSLEKSIIYIGSVWSDIADGVSACLGTIAIKHRAIPFYFKLFVYEEKVRSFIPQEIKYTNLPIVLLKDKGSISLISSGRIKCKELENLVDAAL